MIIKEISTHSFYEDGTRPYLYRDSKRYTPKQWRQILKYLRENAEAGYLRFEIIEEWEIIEE